MSDFSKRPTCKGCWFSKLVVRVTGALYCMKEPEAIQKDDDDFCQHHPAWPEFAATHEGRPISDYYASLR